MQIWERNLDNSLLRKEKTKISLNFMLYCFSWNVLYFVMNVYPSGRVTNKFYVSQKMWVDLFVDCLT